MSAKALEISNLRKDFRSQWTFLPFQALRGISFEVGEGESFGFLGPNGAGKTTTIKCIVGLIKITSGRIAIGGKEIRSAEERKQLGYLPEQPYFYDHLTVQETLEFLASLHGFKGAENRRAVSEALALVRLSERSRSSVRALSKGLQQRLGLAQALVNKPKLLILDEPFSGLDPLGRAEFREIILNLKNGGTTIFLSSHILSDVSDICDRVSIMHKGEIKTVFALKDAPKLFGESYELVTGPLEGQAELQSYLEHAATGRKERPSVHGKEQVFLFSDYAKASEMIPAVIAKGVRIVSFRNSGRNLEEIFIKVTGQGGDAEL